MKKNHCKSLQNIILEEIIKCISNAKWIGEKDTKLVQISIYYKFNYLNLTNNLSI